MFFKWWPADNVLIIYVCLCVQCCISLCFLFQESVLRISEIFNLSVKSSVKGRSNPTRQRNICVVLGCIAEKLAGPSRISILTPGTLNYLIANLVSLLFILCNVHGLYLFYYFQSVCVYRVSMGKPEGKRPLGRPRQRWESNTVEYQYNEILGTSEISYSEILLYWNKSILKNSPVISVAGSTLLQHEFTDKKA